MKETILIAMLHLKFIWPAGDVTQWQQVPMASLEACEIAASMLWENATEVWCETGVFEVTRPRPRPGDFE